MLRLFTDECIPTDWIVILRNLGHDLQTCGEAGLLMTDDDDVLLEHALSENRAMVSTDADFRIVHTRRAMAGKEHPGIVICSERYEKVPDKFRNGALHTLSKFSNESLRNQIIWIVNPPEV